MLGAPAAADAHLRSGIVATDYRATADRLPPVVISAARLRIYATDRALALSVAPGNVVSVLGPSGSPMLRIDDRTGAGTRTVVWHDTRLRRLRAGVQRGSWALPLIVNDRRTRIQGEIWRLRAPPLWPWLLVGLPFMLAVALVRHASRADQVVACTAIAGVAVTATAVIAMGFAASRSASPGRMLEGFDELATAAVASSSSSAARPSGA
jgi:hypothetical protein